MDKIKQLATDIYEICKELTLNNKPLTSEELLRVAVKCDMITNIVEKIQVENVWSCYQCGEIKKPLISISIYFKDETSYDEITELESDDEVEQYVKELIKEKDWEEIYESYDYGHFCPKCMDTLD